MTTIVEPIELATTRRALVELRATLAGLTPLVTWKQDDWLVEATRLQAQLRHLPWLLRGALLASPALDLTTCPSGGARWMLNTRHMLQDFQFGPLPTLTAVLIRLLDRSTPRHVLAGLAARWPLTAGHLLDALEELLGLLQAPAEPS
jgi:hypothetical protein